MVFDYEICVVENGYSFGYKFKKLKYSVLPTFEKFKDDIYAVFPVPKDQPLYLFYRDPGNNTDSLIIDTASDFKLFQEKKIKKLLLAKKVSAPEWPSILQLADAPSLKLNFYKVSVLARESDLNELFVSIPKPPVPNYGHFKQAIVERFPLLKSQRLHIFYMDLFGDRVIINNSSDFEHFQRNMNNKTKVFVVKDADPKVWSQISWDDSNEIGTNTELKETKLLDTTDVLKKDTEGENATQIAGETENGCITKPSEDIVILDNDDVNDMPGTSNDKAKGSRIASDAEESKQTIELIIANLSRILSTATPRLYNRWKKFRKPMSWNRIEKNK